MIAAAPSRPANATLRTKRTTARTKVARLLSCVTSTVIRAMRGDVNVQYMDPRLDYARELEQRDAEVAARIEHGVELARRTDELRSRAEGVETELAHLPERRGRVEAAAAEAERELAAAREALVEAEREQQRTGSGEAAEPARRRLARAEGDVRAAEERHARLLARLAELQQGEERLCREIEELRRLAAELAAELGREPRIAGLPPPPTDADLATLRDWASRAHAALLVARSGLETERDRISREANELATSVLGESVPAMSTAAGRERLASVL